MRKEQHQPSDSGVLPPVLKHSSSDIVASGASHAGRSAGRDGRLYQNLTGINLVGIDRMREASQPQ
jgi:hypothetical protein